MDKSTLLNIIGNQSFITNNIVNFLSDEHIKACVDMDIIHIEPTGLYIELSNNIDNINQICITIDFRNDNTCSISLMYTNVLFGHEDVGRIVHNKLLPMDPEVPRMWEDICDEVECVTEIDITDFYFFLNDLPIEITTRDLLEENDGEWIYPEIHIETQEEANKWLAWLKSKLDVIIKHTA